MAKHAEDVRSQLVSSLILILTPLQTTLLRHPPRTAPLLLRLLLSTYRRSQRALELRMPPWDGNDAWLLDCASLEDALVRRVQRWLVGGR